uniref:ER membrane protein complex subunit 1 n=1 Tax=Erigeron canadensis TaxID=72917 RepID=UPI001CB99920|nr:ER membrane protein complex subunit 1 [Erigeron canadensis]
MAMKLPSVFVIFLLSFSFIPTSFSLFEDQVGFMDWHQRYIGKVKDAVFHTQKAGRKRVVVSTEENVIASLDLRRGDIFWRHVLAANDVIDKIDIALGKYVITLSSEGSILRAWNLPDGQMVWESFLSGSKPSKALLTVPANLKIDLDSPIFVYGGSILHAISSIDGELLWKKDFAAEGIDVHQLILPSGSVAVHIVGVTDSSQFHTYKIDVKNGGLLEHISASISGGIYGEVLPISDETFVALDASRSVLVLITIKNGQMHLQQTQVSDLVHGASGNTIILPSKLSGIFSVSTDACIAFVKVTNEGKLDVMEKVDKTVVVSDALPLSEGEQAFALVQHGDSKIHLSVRLVHDMSSNHLKETVKMDQERGFVHKIFINNYVRTDRSHGFRALIVMEDHSLLLLQQGEIVWSRDDGLASIVDVTTAELPVEKIGVSVAKVEHSLFEWLKGHMLKLKGTLMLATPDEVAAIQKIRLQSSEKSKMTRDHNGFRRLLIVLTRAGKLFALHTGDGRVVWSSLLQSLRSSQQCADPTGLKLHQWQIPHHALDNNPSVLVVGRCGLSLTSPSAMSIIDAHTGKEIQNMGLAHSTVQVISLPFSDSTEQQLHLLIDADKQAHLYPRTPEAVEIFKRESENLYWYSVEAEVGILRGYGLKSSCNLDVPNEYCFETRNLWSIVFPSESEKIIAAVTRKANEVVHTQAKVIADEDVMYKYVSKNMLFVATVSPKASGPIGSATPDESVLVVYLVDTVTGRILHRVTHLGSQGPVHAVLSENWVVYHYFNLRAHRYEMSVIEIYDQSRAENKDVLKLIVGKHNLTTPISSYSRPEVTTKSQSYFFTHSVKAISVTSTAKGITSKHLLIGTIGDQVLALDKRFVDPRRSLNPTQAEKEEGLLPLTDTLPIISQSYVTHAFKVEGLRGIETVPAKLESTTLVFAYGVDLFFTRLAPSRTYDSLTEDFNYALLLLTIVALVVAIFVTWVLSERKDLQDKWR